MVDGRVSKDEDYAVQATQHPHERRWGESGGEDEQVPVLGVAAK